MFNDISSYIWRWERNRIMYQLSNYERN